MLAFRIKEQTTSNDTSPYGLRRYASMCLQISAVRTAKKRTVEVCFDHSEFAADFCGDFVNATTMFELLLSLFENQFGDQSFGTGRHIAEFSSNLALFRNAGLLRLRPEYF